MAEGVRSFAAFWMGGAASTEPPPAVTPGTRSFAAFWMGGAAMASGVIEPPITPEQATGGWEDWLTYQARRKKQKQQLEAKLAAEKLALEQAEKQLAIAEQRKAEEARKTKADTAKLDRLNREIRADRLRLAAIQEHIDALLTLIYLENEQRVRIEQQKRNRAIALLLLVH